MTSVINRYYDPTTDEFLSIDPEVAATDQPYAFVNDDPLNAEDPFGLGPVAAGGNTNTDTLAVARALAQARALAAARAAAAAAIRAESAVKAEAAAQSQAAANRAADSAKAAATAAKTDATYAESYTNQATNDVPFNPFAPPSVSNPYGVTPATEAQQAATSALNYATNVVSSANDFDFRGFDNFVTNSTVDTAVGACLLFAGASIYASGGLTTPAAVDAGSACIYGGAFATGAS